jgi:hypothetical protein
VHARHAGFYDGSAEVPEGDVEGNENREVEHGR